jgi:hypothetical protein
MLTIPSPLRTQFKEYLRDKTVPPNTQIAYIKWLRYDLDFCQKYHFPPEYKESLPYFLKTLQRNGKRRHTKSKPHRRLPGITSFLSPDPLYLPLSAPPRRGNPPLTPPRRGIRLSATSIPYSSFFILHSSFLTAPVSEFLAALRR